MFKVIFGLTSAFILFVIILAKPDLAQFFSYAKPIDPQNIAQNTTSFGPAFFNNQTIEYPPPPTNIPPQVLGDTTSSKRIEVDLTAQRLYAFEDNKLVFNFLISSGKWGRTPTGDFKIWIKVLSQKMEGGSKLLGTYYNLPNVPYVMFFYNDIATKEMGFSFHGTYWHHNFGMPMSHGCINMKTEEAAILYNWANVGTPVTIFGQYQYPVSSNASPPQS